MAEERKIPASALDVGENAAPNDAADIKRAGINANDGQVTVPDTNEAPSESREEQAERLKKQKQASFEYADKYRQKLKNDAAERRLTPAQMRKKAEKEAAIAREKEERERAIRQAIEREKEEAKQRAESASALRDQVEKSLADKKAQEEAEREAAENAVSEAPMTEPVSEPVSEPVEETPVEETHVEEAPVEEEPEMAEEEPKEEPLAEEESYGEPEEESEDMLFTFDPEKPDEDDSADNSDDNDMLLTFDYDGELEEEPEEEPEEPKEQPNRDMILTYYLSDDDIQWDKLKEKKKPAPVAEEPVAEEPAEEPVKKAEKPAETKAKAKKKKRKPRKAVRTPKKAKARPKKRIVKKTVAKKPVAKKPIEDKNNVIVPVVPVLDADKTPIDDEIAKLLEENKQLLKENIDELRRKQAELEKRQDALESATPAPVEPVEEEAPESPEEAVSEPVTEEIEPIPEEILLAADESPEAVEEIVPEEEPVAEVIRPINLIHENRDATKVLNRGVRGGVVEEIPESEMIINYTGEADGALPGYTDINNYNNATYINNYGSDAPDAVGVLGSIAGAAGLAALSPALLKKKIKDNDKIVNNLRKKLAEADKDYRVAKTKEAKIEKLAECAEYQRSILDFDAESLEATKHLGKNTDKRRRDLHKDISKYNAYAQKLEKRSMTQVAQASTSIPEDIIAGRPYARLPQIIQRDLDGNEIKDAKSPMSYISQLDNDEDGVIGAGQGVPKSKKKYKLSKKEVRRSARELKQQMRANNRLLKENRRDLRYELNAAKDTDYTQKTDHLVAALNYEREILAILGDGYEASVRTQDTAQAKKLSHQIDKEIAYYNKLAKVIENRTGEPLPQAFNTYAKDVSDNKEAKLPPVVKYVTPAVASSIVDSEDVIILKRIDPVEQFGTEKLVKLGQETRTAQPLPTVYTTADGLGTIMVAPPTGDGQVVVIGDPNTAPTQTITPLGTKSYKINEESRAAATPQAPTIVYIQPSGVVAQPMAPVQAEEKIRPLAARITESRDEAKVIPADPALGIEKAILSIAEGEKKEENTLAAVIKEDLENAKRIFAGPKEDKDDSAAAIAAAAAGVTVLPLAARVIENLTDKKTIAGKLVDNATELAAPVVENIVEAVARPLSERVAEDDSAKKTILGSIVGEVIEAVIDADDKKSVRKGLLGKSAKAETGKFTISEDFDSAKTIAGSVMADESVQEDTVVSTDATGKTRPVVYTLVEDTDEFKVFKAQPAPVTAEEITVGPKTEKLSLADRISEDHEKAKTIPGKAIEDGDIDVIPFVAVSGDVAEIAEVAEEPKAEIVEIEEITEEPKAADETAEVEAEPETELAEIEEIIDEPVAEATETAETAEEPEASDESELAEIEEIIDEPVAEAVETTEAVEALKDETVEAEEKESKFESADIESMEEIADSEDDETKENVTVVDEPKAEATETEGATEETVEEKNSDSINNIVENDENAEAAESTEELVKEISESEELAEEPKAEIAEAEELIEEAKDEEITEENTSEETVEEATPVVRVVAEDHEKTRVIAGTKQAEETVEEAETVAEEAPVEEVVATEEVTEEPKAEATEVAETVEEAKAEETVEEATPVVRVIAEDHEKTRVIAGTKQTEETVEELKSVAAIEETKVAKIPLIDRISEDHEKTRKVLAEKATVAEEVIEEDKGTKIPLIDRISEDHEKTKTVLAEVIVEDAKKEEFEDDQDVAPRYVIETADSAKIVKADVAPPVAPRYDKVPLEEREVQIITPKRVVETADSAKVVKANIPGVNTDESFDFLIPISVAGSAKESVDDSMFYGYAPETQSAEDVAEEKVEEKLQALIFADEEEPKAEVIKTEEVKEEPKAEVAETEEVEKELKAEVAETEEVKEEPKAEATETEEVEEEPKAEATETEETTEEKVVEEATEEQKTEAIETEEALAEEKTEETAEEVEAVAEEAPVEEVVTEEVAEEPKAEATEATEVAETVEEAKAEETVEAAPIVRVIAEDHEKTRVIAGTKQVEETVEAVAAEEVTEEPKAEQSAVEEAVATEKVEETVEEAKAEEPVAAPVVRVIAEDHEKTRVIAGTKQAEETVEAVATEEVTEEPKAEQSAVEEAVATEKAEETVEEAKAEEPVAAPIVRVVAEDHEKTRVIAGTKQVEETVEVAVATEEVAEEAKAEETVEEAAPVVRVVAEDHEKTRVIAGTKQVEETVAEENVEEVVSEKAIEEPKYAALTSIRTVVADESSAKEEKHTASIGEIGTIYVGDLAQQDIVADEAPVTEEVVASVEETPVAEEPKVENINEELRAEIAKAKEAKEELKSEIVKAGEAKEELRSEISRAEELKFAKAKSQETTEEYKVEVVEDEKVAEAPKAEESAVEETVVAEKVEETKSEEPVAAPVVRVIAEDHEKTRVIAGAKQVEETVEAVAAEEVTEEPKTEQPAVEEAVATEKVEEPVEEAKAEEAVEEAAPVVRVIAEDHEKTRVIAGTKQVEEAVEAVASEEVTEEPKAEQSAVEEAVATEKVEETVEEAKAEEPVVAPVVRVIAEDHEKTRVIAGTKQVEETVEAVAAEEVAEEPKAEQSAVEEAVATEKVEEPVEEAKAEEPVAAPIVRVIAEDHEKTRVIAGTKQVEETVEAVAAEEVTEEPKAEQSAVEEAVATEKVEETVEEAKAEEAVEEAAPVVRVIAEDHEKTRVIAGTKQVEEAVEAVVATEEVAEEPKAEAIETEETTEEIVATEETTEEKVEEVVSEEVIDEPKAEAHVTEEEVAEEPVAEAIEEPEVEPQLMAVEFDGTIPEVIDTLEEKPEEKKEALSEISEEEMMVIGEAPETQDVISEVTADEVVAEEAPVDTAREPEAVEAVEARQEAEVTEPVAEETKAEETTPVLKVVSEDFESAKVIAKAKQEDAHVVEESSVVEEAPVEEKPEEAEPADKDESYVDLEKVIVKTAKPSYIIIEERPAQTSAEPEINVEEVIAASTDTYVLKELIPVRDETEEIIECVDNNAADQGDTITPEDGKASYIIKEYPPMSASTSDADEEISTEKVAIAERPEEVIIYGKEKATKAPEAEVVRSEGKILDAPKSKGAYTLTEEIREVVEAPVEETVEEEILHVGEEIVTVVDDEPVAEVPAEEAVAEAKRGVVVDESATKVIEERHLETPKAKGSYKLLEETREVVKESAEAVDEVKKEVSIDESAAKVIEGRELETPKAKGAYSIVEKSREATKAPVEETVEEEILHVGEEIVTVVEDGTEEDKFAILTSDSATEAEKATDKAKISNTITVSGDGRGYTVTEMPDSAKRFEAAPATEIKKGSYTITVAPDQAKKIEGRPEISYTVNVDEDGKKVLSATPSSEIVAPAVKYGVVESPEDARVISAREEKPEIIVSPEDAMTIAAAEAEHIVTVIDDKPVAEAPVETAPEKKEYTGYILTENSNETKIISGKEEARGYSVTEQPESTKKIAAAPDTEIVKENYTIVVSNEQAKTIEGRPELHYSINVDEDGKKVVSSAPTKVVMETPVEKQAFASSETIDVEELHGGNEIITVIEDQIPENYSILTPISDADVVEEKTSKKAALDNTIVIEESRPKVQIVEGSAKVIAGKAEQIQKTPDYVLVSDDRTPVEEFEERYVSEDVEATKVIPAIKILNAPKSKDTYVIAENVDSAKVVGAKGEEKASEYKLEVHDDQTKTVAAGIKKDKFQVVSEEAKVIKSEKTGKYIISESPENAKVLNKAEEKEYTLAVHPEDTRIISAEKRISESENPKTILASNKVLNTSKAQNAYAILESRDTKVISAADKKEDAVVSGRYTLGISNDTKVIEGTAATTYKIGTEEDHAKVIEAIEILKKANYDVSEIERSEKTIPAAKILNTSKSGDTYIITESRDAKIISSEPTDTVAQPVEEIVMAAKESRYDIVEERRIAKAAPAAKVINAHRSKDSYVILEQRGSEKVIGTEEPEEETRYVFEQPGSEAKFAARKAKRGVAHKELVISERHNAAKVIPGFEEEIREGYEIAEQPRTEVIIPAGTKILNTPKAKERYIISERRGTEKTIYAPDPVKEIFEIENSELRVRAKADAIPLTSKSTYRINQDDSATRTIHRAVSEAETLARGKNYLVYETGAAHVIGQRKISKPGKPLVYEQIGSERVIGTDEYKRPERPLVYEEIGTHKTILAESGIKAKIKDNIIEYMGTEAVIRGDIPVVDVLIDPYKNINMGVLSTRDLKKFLSENDKEIAHLKHDLKYANKKKNSCEKSAEKIMAHIAMINYQCLICEKYVERINVCNNAEAEHHAKMAAEALGTEIKKYNDFMTEYNVLTSSKIPLADKTLPKRVLAGKAYEHLTRISYNVVNEQAPVKTKKNKTKAKIIQENRYMADIKLLNRRDEETANSVSVVENRYVFETALLKGEKDIMAFKFAKNSNQNAKRKAYISRKLKSLKRQKAKAVRYEAMDNERYYRVLTCDTNLESYNNNNLKKKKVTKIVAEVSELLRQRDELNSKLNAIYTGPLGDITGANEGDKWREVKVAAAKTHSRKLKSKANALKNSVPGFGEKKAERVFAFNSLLDAKVEALSTIDLCKYRLKKEKNSLMETISIRKDMAEARKRVKLIDREIKEKKKVIHKEHYGPDGSTDIVVLLVMCILGVVALILGAQQLGFDVMGTIKPYISQFIDMIKGFLM